MGHMLPPITSCFEFSVADILWPDPSSFAKNLVKTVLLFHLLQEFLDIFVLLIFFHAINHNLDLHNKKFKMLKKEIEEDRKTYNAYVYPQRGNLQNVVISTEIPTQVFIEIEKQS